ncbi:phosphatase 2C-domain-containing protein [Hygrophoropsis aurantiaca]|uniref:Phosphatase 2C-domain-containing protein n=1 Tax=Hygrophoropsis aurantiaca TaxID=72124 RepID=A0ACB8AUL5_9AGAM|nr:phosphatase 2C-domain-containing protein [Hygrophoropsis aurantiaca]
MTSATPRFSDSPNARSKSITTANGVDTYGTLNQHAAGNVAYQVGVSEDKGTRRYMEDAHSFVIDYAGVRGQGFFAVFDGHAGKHAAEWCGEHFHEYLLESLNATPTATIPDVLNETFHNVDKRISRMCEESEGKIHSGCTAVTAFLRIEDSDGQQPFLNGSRSASPPSPAGDTKSEASSGSDTPSGESSEEISTTKDGKVKKPKKSKSSSSGSRIAKALKNLGGGSSSSVSSTPSNTVLHSNTQANTTPVVLPPPSLRRVLYSANAGDARGVLCRAGKAVRLTYDHKGSDKQEAKRITDAGGFVMSGRVNGVLAVTRSLGDSAMKEFVVGSPYTTETELCDDDEFVILACDGLWDITGDQGAIDLIRNKEDAQEASQTLVNHALARQTNDNVTVLVVRFKSSPKHST